MSSQEQYGTDELEALLGADVARAFNEAVIRADTMSEESIKAVARAGVEKMVATKQFRVEVGGRDVVMVHVPRAAGLTDKFRVGSTNAGNYKVMVQWAPSGGALDSATGSFITVFAPFRQWLESLASPENQGRYYVLVGRVGSTTGRQGGTLYNIRLLGRPVPLSEVRP